MFTTPIDCQSPTSSTSPEDVKFLLSSRTPYDTLPNPFSPGPPFNRARPSTQDSDLHSALFLEQAAYCFVRMRRRHLRKFAFYMVLSGHRYNVASQVSSLSFRHLRHSWIATLTAQCIYLVASWLICGAWVFVGIEMLFTYECKIYSTSLLI